MLDLAIQAAKSAGKILKENFDKRFNDGQLDDCPLNRFDLEQIKLAFLPILSGVFHPRLEYGENNQNVGDHQNYKDKL